MTWELCVDRACILSRFSHVQLFVTQWTVPTKFLCPWNSPGKITRVGHHALLGDLRNPGIEPHTWHIPGGMQNQTKYLSQ